MFGANWLLQPTGLYCHDRRPHSRDTHTQQPQGKATQGPYFSFQSRNRNSLFSGRPGQHSGQG
ncbi:hypothetical protein E2C01_062963 [Portunus trituberculatus]|uniref:Uncharacterized protein n=1 Tax=Portunus trituberculatus TaxID=210409 RepID=A0A5B7HJI4_PORTR|nr:hypothetical protein [Portunus trituberculatus]